MIYYNLNIHQFFAFSQFFKRKRDKKEANNVTLERKC